ncbi:MAG: hypothetical protein RLZZ598_1980, partial [Pseudomonadota bacterium]
MMKNQQPSEPVRFDGQRLRIEDVLRLARRRQAAELSSEPAFRARI